MIKKYTEYIKEDYNINNKYNSVYKFICKYLNDNKVKYNNYYDILSLAC